MIRPSLRRGLTAANRSVACHVLSTATSSPRPAPSAPQRRWPTRRLFGGLAVRADHAGLIRRIRRVGSHVADVADVGGALRCDARGATVRQQTGQRFLSPSPDRELRARSCDPAPRYALQEGQRPRFASSNITNDLLVYCGQTGSLHVPSGETAFMTLTGVAGWGLAVRGNQLAVGNSASQINTTRACRASRRPRL